jgi:phosphatidate cytidylyltransferase
MGGLRLRVITAVFFVLIMLGGVFGGKIPFLLLFGFINGMCLWEFTGLIFSEDNRQNLIRRSIGVALGWLPYAWLSALNLGIIPDDCWLPMLLTFFPLLFLPFVFELSQGNTQAFQAVGFIFLTTIYIGVPFALLNALAFIGSGFSFHIPLGLMLMTWTSDTSAYLVGSKLGKTPLFPKISPKKTWEGSLGAAFFTLIVAWGLWRLFPELGFQHWLVLGIIVIVFGSIGDLVESSFKRGINIKDSSALLPGHGGFLDRFDGFMFQLPFSAAYLFWVIN